MALATGRPASHQQHVLLGTQQVGGVDEGRPCPPKVVGDNGVEAGGELLQAGGPGGLLPQRRLQLLQCLKAPRDLLLAQLPQRHLLHVLTGAEGMSAPSLPTPGTPQPCFSLSTLPSIAVVPDGPQRGCSEDHQHLCHNQQGLSPSPQHLLPIFMVFMASRNMSLLKMRATRSCVVLSKVQGSTRRLGTFPPSTPSACGCSRSLA